MEAQHLSEEDITRYAKSVNVMEKKLQRLIDKGLSKNDAYKVALPFPFRGIFEKVGNHLAECPRCMRSIQLEIKNMAQTPKDINEFNDQSQRRTSTMGTIMDAVEKFLNEQNWKFRKIPEKEVIICNLRGTEASFTLIIHPREEKSVLLIQTQAENNVPEGKRLMVVDFLNRLNYRMQVGNFEMDMEDGEFRFRTSIDIEGGTLTTAMIRNLIQVGMVMMDRAYPYIMGIIYGGITATEAEKKFFTRVETSGS